MVLINLLSLIFQSTHELNYLPMPLPSHVEAPEPPEAPVLDQPQISSSHAGKPVESLIYYIYFHLASKTLTGTVNLNLSL